jgi:hypothetical protein
MIELGEDQYRELCQAGRVQSEIGAMADRRRSALLMFWLFLIVGLGLAGLSFWIALGNDHLILGTILASVLAIGAMGAAAIPLSKVGRDLKLPVLETLARQSGLTYTSHGFTPPVYEEAKGPLFGTWLSSQTFTDLFQGTDADGRHFAIYEAYLTRSSGKSTHVVFTGQIYAFQRRDRGGGRILIVPDRGIFNFFQPTPGLERASFDSDPEFENKFQVYAAQSHEALALLGSGARRKFLEWRRGGRVMAHIGPEDIFVAIPGKNRFEPGSMFRATDAEQRVRTMFDDLRASLATLRSLKASLDVGL